MLAEIQTNVAELFGPRARTPAYGCTSRLLPSSKKEPLCSGWRDPSFHEEAGLIYPACRLRGTAASAQKEAPAADGPTLMLCQRLRARGSTHTSLSVGRISQARAGQPMPTSCIRTHRLSASITSATGAIAIAQEQSSRSHPETRAAAKPGCPTRQIQRQHRPALIAGRQEGLGPVGRDRARRGDRG